MVAACTFDRGYLSGYFPRQILRRPGRAARNNCCGHRRDNNRIATMMIMIYSNAEEPSK